METAWTLAQPTRPRAPAIRRIRTADVWDALRRGWEDFRANPTQLIFLAIIYPIVGLVSAQAMAGRDIMPLFWPMLSGFALVGPVAALGIYELSRRREKGLPVSWLNALDIRRSPALSSIVGLGIMLLVIFVAWLMMAQGIYNMTMGEMRPSSVGEFVNRVLHTREGHQLIVIGNFVGFLFAATVLTLTVISFPLLLDRAAEGQPVDAGMAIRASYKAVMVNPGPMMLWGLIVAGLLLLGSIPFFVGLAVVMPVLGHGTWHLYRKTIAH